MRDIDEVFHIPARRCRRCGGLLTSRANHMSYQTVLDRCNGKVKKPFALDGTTYVFDD